MNQQTARQETRTTRTCVGCGLRDDAASMLRFVVADGQMFFDAHVQGGRGAHIHPRASCLLRAPRGLSRAFKADVRFTAAELGQRLVEASERRMRGLFLAARRRGSLAIGADAAAAALTGGAPLAVVAIDAGAARKRAEVERAILAGRAIVWKTKAELGVLLGAPLVAICAVLHAGIAHELQFTRAAADAGTAATGAGGECSRSPEAR